MRIVLLTIALCCSICQAADDWRVQAFESAQSLFTESELQESALLTKVAPETKSFYDLWLPMQAAVRKRDMIAFNYKLKHTPETIDWSNVWLWIDATSSTQEEKHLITVCPEYAEAYKNFQICKDRLLSNKDAFKIRNEGVATKWLER